MLLYLEICNVRSRSHDQKFAIRSPPHPGSRFVKSDQENNESSEEASHEESDQQNSSDEEVSFLVCLLQMKSCVYQCKQTRGQVFVDDNSQFNKLGGRDRVVTSSSPFSPHLVSLSPEMFCTPTSHTFVI